MTDFLDISLGLAAIMLFLGMGIGSGIVFGMLVQPHVSEPDVPQSRGFEVMPAKTWRQEVK